MMASRSAVQAFDRGVRAPEAVHPKPKPLQHKLEPRLLDSMFRVDTPFEMLCCVMVQPVKGRRKRSESPGLTRDGDFDSLREFAQNTAARPVSTKRSGESLKPTPGNSPSTHSATKFEDTNAMALPGVGP